MSKGKRGGFGGGGGMGNMQGLMQQARQMQAKMEEIQKDLETKTAEAQAGGGAVKAVVTGKQELVSLTIDPGALDDAELLQDMVKAAVNEAIKLSKEMSEKAMGGAMGNMPIPPGFF
jgi:DNA-binding YbaB/EbfC family protein